MRVIQIKLSIKENKKLMSSFILVENLLTPCCDAYAEKNILTALEKFNFSTCLKKKKFFILLTPCGYCVFSQSFFFHCF